MLLKTPGNAIRVSDSATVGYITTVNKAWIQCYESVLPVLRYDCVTYVNCFSLVHCCADTDFLFVVFFCFCFLISIHRLYFTLIPLLSRISVWNILRPQCVHSCPLGFNGAAISASSYRTAHFPQERPISRRTAFSPRTAYVSQDRPICPRTDPSPP